jgi:hypothetical protein
VAPPAAGSALLFAILKVIV